MHERVENIVFFTKNQEEAETFLMFLISLTVPILIILKTPLPFLFINLFIFAYRVKLSFHS
jgi:ABC-type glycerol-3-phosphate transport system substrate-binding protein